MGTVKIDLDYGKQSFADVALGPNDILVAKFTTGATIGKGGSIGVVEHNAERWNRNLCISTTPEDFEKNSVSYDKMSGGKKPVKKTVTTNFSEGFDPSIAFNADPASGGFALLPNTTYCVNVKTIAASQQNCAVRITLTPGR